MCGHAVIALGRYAIDYGIVKPVSPETLVQIQCPCGLVAAHVEYSEGRSGAVRFESVPAFAFATDLTVTVEGLGEVKYDIGYGGAFYALVCAAQLSLDLCLSPVGDLIQAGDAITSAVKASVAVTHPESADLAFLYGTILTDGRDEYSAETPSANLCIFADRQVSVSHHTPSSPPSWCAGGQVPHGVRGHRSDCSTVPQETDTARCVCAYPPQLL